MRIRVKKLNESAMLPYRATEGAAAYDLFALVAKEGIMLQPKQQVMVGTGIAIELPNEQYVALIFPRSGLAVNHGLTLPNCVGVIDSDYRGELKIPVVNKGNKAFLIENHSRIAQIAIMPVYAAEFEEVEELTATKRGEGGFGHSEVRKTGQ